MSKKIFLVTSNLSSHALSKVFVLEDLFFGWIVPVALFPPPSSSSFLRMCSNPVREIPAACTHWLVNLLFDLILRRNNTASCPSPWQSRMTPDRLTFTSQVDEELRTITLRDSRYRELVNEQGKNWPWLKTCDDHLFKLAIDFHYSDQSLELYHQSGLAPQYPSHLWSLNTRLIPPYIHQVMIRAEFFFKLPAMLPWHVGLLGPCISHTNNCGHGSVQSPLPMECRKVSFATPPQDPG